MAEFTPKWSGSICTAVSQDRVNFTQGKPIFFHKRGYFCSQPNAIFRNISANEKKESNTDFTTYFIVNKIKAKNQNTGLFQVRKELAAFHFSMQGSIAIVAGIEVKSRSNKWG